MIQPEKNEATSFLSSEDLLVRTVGPYVFMLCQSFDVTNQDDSSKVRLLQLLDNRRSSSIQVLSTAQLNMPECDHAQTNTNMTSLRFTISILYFL